MIKTTMISAVHHKCIELYAHLYEALFDIAVACKDNSKEALLPVLLTKVRSFESLELGLGSGVTKAYMLNNAEEYIKRIYKLVEVLDLLIKSHNVANPMATLDAERLPVEISILRVKVKMILLKNLVGKLLSAHVKLKREVNMLINK